MRLARHSRFQLGFKTLIILLASFFMLGYNQSMWIQLANIIHIQSHWTYLFFPSFFIFFTCVTSLILLLVSFKPIFKPVVILLFWVSAVAAYHMNQYGISFDTTMIQNIVETNVNEAKALMSKELILYLLLLGALPTLLLLRTKIIYPQRLWMTQLQRFIFMIALIAVAIAQLPLFYSYYAPVFRQHREITHSINPGAYLVAGIKFIKNQGVTSTTQMVVSPIDETPRARHPEQPAMLSIMVVGETARADHFSLNGYTKNTNPRLSQRHDILYFSDVNSCGTVTAVSVPCMFSMYNRTDYSDSNAKSHENLLDVLHRAGVAVSWRDNNSDCKGVCLRIPNETPQQLRIDLYCPTDCFDEVLLENLQPIIDKTQDQPTLIVLHMMGSHGPAYSERYPKEFEQFKPVCTDNVLGNCDTNALNNVYDNTIVYTDYILDKTIALLEQQTRPSHLLYVSDHGESLGENGLYLHGAPYMLAPTTQTHIPMMMWFNEAAQTSLGLNQGCLAQQQTRPWSHDNVFHTMLGIFQIESNKYQAELDILTACQAPNAYALGTTNIRYD